MAKCVHHDRDDIKTTIIYLSACALYTTNRLAELESRHCCTIVNQNLWAYKLGHITQSMTKQTKKHPQSDAIHEEALRIARGTQRPGQTKEQTRLITQGIQKGIEQYKKQQSAKARELDRNLKKAKQQPAENPSGEIEIHEKIVYRHHWLPWVLLALSWICMSLYLFFWNPPVD
jgi:hypothetical protein